MAEPLNKENLIRAIAHESHIRREVVALVLEKLTDIALEEIVNKGSFRMENLFAVSEHEVKNLKVPKGRHTEGGVLPATTRLSTKLSPTVKKLYRLQREFPDSPKLVNRDTWRDALKWREEGNHGPARQQLQDGKSPQKTVELHNPFLDDDD